MTSLQKVILTSLTTRLIIIVKIPIKFIHCYDFLDDEKTRTISHSNQIFQRYKTTNKMRINKILIIRRLGSLLDTSSQRHRKPETEKSVSGNVAHNGAKSCAKWLLILPSGWRLALSWKFRKQNAALQRNKVIFPPNIVHIFTRSLFVWP